MKPGNELNDQASLEPHDLEDLSAQVRSLFEVRDRRSGLAPRLYEKCFVGSEAVQSLIRSDLCSDVDDAVRIGNLLLQAGVFHHVLDEHAFEDKKLFYRFLADEDHGKVTSKPDGSGVSWADFLNPVASKFDDDLTLQADVPERDPNLGDFAQEDLEAIGVTPLDEHNAKLLDCTHPRAWVDPIPKKKYNLVVIGAGAGGLVTASAAAGVGARVALIESHLLGGDCLNVGCVPSKALIRCAKVAASVRDSGDFGVRVRGEVEVDFGAVMERMRRLRASIAPVDSARRFADELGVDVFIGRGVFTGKNSIEVNGKTLQFAKAVIATGGTAAIPDIPGLGDAPFMTNASVFNLTELPARLGVIGAGPIGMELAQSFQRFGSQVTVFSRQGSILPKEDPDAARIVEGSMRRDGVRFEFHTKYQRVECNGSDLPVTVVVAGRDGERRLEFDALLVAAGRKPSVDGLGLEEAGVEFDRRLGVVVSEKLQTTNSSIYAVGDVATRYQFTHMADFMARLVVRNALFLGRDKSSDLLVPWATYTEPEIAHVGLYEKDLQARGIEYTTIRRDFDDVDRAILEGDTAGFVKIHLKKGTDEILGATIVGSHAGDMISEISVAIHAKMGLGRLASVIHPYPTVAEAIRQCGDAYNRTRLTPTVKKIFNRLMSLQR